MTPPVLRHTAGRFLLNLALASLAGTAVAHDTWFTPMPVTPAGEPQLALGTGNQFPVYDSPIGTEYLPQQGCRGASGQAIPMAPVRYDPAALVLRLPVKPQGAVSCWVQTSAFNVDMPLEKVPVYFNEVRPPQAMRDAWAGMAARNLPWTERYVKHARVELPGAGEPAQPSGLGMDMVIEGPRTPLKVGDTVSVQVLRDGQPLPELAVEWRNDRGRVGIWRRTDAQGRVSLKLPLPGQWLLRGVDMRLSASVPDAYDSRFMTLTFTVAAR